MVGRTTNATLCRAVPGATNPRMQVVTMDENVTLPEADVPHSENDISVAGLPADANVVPLDHDWCERMQLSDVAQVECLDDSGMHVRVTFNDGTQRQSTYPEAYPA